MQWLLISYELPHTQSDCHLDYMSLYWIEHMHSYASLKYYDRLQVGRSKYVKIEAVVNMPTTYSMTVNFMCTTA